MAAADEEDDDGDLSPRIEQQGIDSNHVTFYGVGQVQIMNQGCCLVLGLGCHCEDGVLSSSVCKSDWAKVYINGKVTRRTVNDCD